MNSEIIDCDCPECEGENHWDVYQVFSVKEWLCERCYEDFVYGDDEE
jgi:transposase-like protein